MSRWITIAVLVLLVVGLGGFYYYDTYWLEPSGFYPYPLPVPLHDATDALVPMWEASQVQGFVDLDAAQATFSVADKTVLTVPVELPSVVPSAVPAARA